MQYQEEHVFHTRNSIITFHSPSIVVIDASIPVPESNQMAENILATTNIINLKTDQMFTQHSLRTISGPTLLDATNRLYQRLPDNFDFLYFLSTDLIERVPYTSANNFTKGNTVPVKIDFTGNATQISDTTDLYGSKGRLKSVNGLDYLQSGLVSNNFLHELMHLWLVKFDPSFGINVGSHYSGLASVSGILYGDNWIENGDGTFTRECRRPPTHTQVNNLEKYMMGFLAADQVEPIYVLENNANAIYECGEVIQGDIRTVTIEDIQAVHRPRVPTVAEAQKDFNIGFVVETHNRFLTPTELAFYHLMAQHIVKPVADDEAAPVIRLGNWARINRFFGPGVTFSTDVPYRVPAAATNVFFRSKFYKVNVVWNAVADAESYLVYSKADTETEFKLAGEVTTTVFVDQIPRSANNVTYYIVAKNSYGIGPHSASIVATPTFRRTR